MKQELTVRIRSFPETNGKRNWTAMLIRTTPWDGLAGNAGGITVAHGELWNRVAYAAERTRFLLGERHTEPPILEYGIDVNTPAEWTGNDPESAVAVNRAESAQWNQTLEVPGLGRVTFNDNVLSLLFKDEESADAFGHRLSPTVEVDDMPQLAEPQLYVYTEVPPGFRQEFRDDGFHRIVDAAGTAKSGWAPYASIAEYNGIVSATGYFLDKERLLTSVDFAKATAVTVFGT